MAGRTLSLSFIIPKLGGNYLRYGTYKFVEDIVSNYHKYPEYIKRREEEILHPYKVDDSNPEGGKGNLTGDPTAQAALALYEDRRLNCLKDEQEAVRRALESSSSQVQEMIELYYQKEHRELTWHGVAVRVGYSRRQCLRLRDQLFKEIAKSLGLT